MANSHDGNAQVLSYPQHPPKDFSDLAATLIKNGLGGVDVETLERHLEQVGYFRLNGNQECAQQHQAGMHQRYINVENGINCTNHQSREKRAFDQ